MSIFSASALLENVMRFTRDGGRREGSWREGCNQTFLHTVPFLTSTAELQMCPYFVKGFLERGEQNIKETVTCTYSVPFF